MGSAMRTGCCLTMLALMGAGPVAGQDLSGCSFNGIDLWGDVQVVDNFADIKVEVVDSFPDLNVELVDDFPDDCGQWKMVDSFPDFTIEIVDSFPDIKIEYVTNFPGVE